MRGCFMHIIGHGIDIVEIDSLAHARARAHFDERCFTQHELEHGTKAASTASFFAGRFAAKEAVLKALGTGMVDGLSWHDIEIAVTDTGAPSVDLRNGVAVLARSR